ncbi:hypothetical protein [Burkholderia pyrrocinia]|uniref:hypothetical protein n=1 Tax=Burkholderia pyrrocinia TaxID=60550 RepID=UPI002AB323E9|nr:hypothetical protein [Burkholderia pyrrocinia]
MTTTDKINEPCQGVNCGCTDGKSHSLECVAQHAATVAGNGFAPAPAATSRADALSSEHRAAINAAIDMLEVRAWSGDQQSAAHLRALLAALPATQPAPAPADERSAFDLPPLPWPTMPHGSIDYFSAGQMRDYARAALACAVSASETAAEGATERALSRTIDERDRMEEDGTRLAEAVGDFLGVDVGEWSSANNPILSAIEALESRSPAMAAEAVAILPCAPDLYFYGDHEHGFECPDDAAIVSGRKLGDRFTLNAAWYADVLFEVTKVPDDTSDDYEVREVAAPQPPAQADATGLSE